MEMTSAGADSATNTGEGARTAERVNRGAVQAALLTRIYGVAIFASAFLLFEVQPLITKMILPWFGGVAAVWTVCLVFFQVALLAGYFYVHVLTSKVRPAVQ